MRPTPLPALPLVLLLACCIGGRPADPDPGDEDDPYVEVEATVILISVDGFRHDYRGLAETPVLDRLAAEGVEAEALVPVFPSNTFPSHYSMATGLRPANHGIIDNVFYAPDLNATFQMSNTAANADPRWWGGEPIWITAERQGVTAGTFFWVGSEVQREDGLQQTWAVPYDGSVPFEERVAQVLEWLDDEERPPRLVTLYFSQPDSAGHTHGPLDHRVLQRVEEVDGLIGQLVDGLEARGRLDETNLVVVSDHGMAATHASRQVYLDEHINLNEVWVHRWGSWASIWPKDPSRTAALVEALADLPNASCAAREDLPDHLAFGGGVRVPPVVCLAEVGWLITHHGWTGSVLQGNHGFDPAHPDMHGLFLARGPHVRQGVTVDAFEGIDIYPLLARMLQIEPAANDGTLPVEVLRSP